MMNLALINFFARSSKRVRQKNKHGDNVSESTIAENRESEIQAAKIEMLERENKRLWKLLTQFATTP